MSIEEKLNHFFALKGITFENLEIDFLLFKISLVSLYKLAKKIGGVENFEKQLPGVISSALNLKPCFGESMGLIPALFQSYRYLSDFDIWLNTKKIKNSDPDNVEPMITLRLGSECQKNCDYFGINCIYTALASGLPNEIDIAIVVLLKMSTDPEALKILSKMKVLTILLPGILGVFSDEYKKSNQWLYLKKVPLIKSCAQYINRNSAKFQHKPWNSGDCDLYDTNDLLENFVDDESIHRRFYYVLLILWNIFNYVEYKISSTSPVLTLLLECIDSRIPSLSKKGFKILELISRKISIKKCSQSERLHQVLHNSIEGSDRSKIILSLKIIINITTSELNINSSCDVEADINPDPIFELLGCYDAEITLLSLQTLQVLTANKFLGHQTKMNTTYINSLANLLLESDKIQDQFNHVYNPKLKNSNISDQNIKTQLIAWLEKNYTKDIESGHTILFDIFVKLFDDFKTDGNIKLYMLELLEYAFV
ncbi:hypothetical protein RF11_13373 [Thelohanellus kitauei]|uniref:Uncharacterized protein n=1 Tax=Thelohanellus kitauei TaxID=669202 RepID=A0A0C2MM10_THEKT|nr:hypothetical protein RF11_13373 [Thelohanellus kitauei]